MRYIAFVTKGLEQVVVEELKHLITDVDILEVGDKRVLFDSEQPLATLTSLRTVDDLCLFVSKIESAQNIASLLSAVREADFDRPRSIISELRALKDDFSITTTMVGVESFSAAQLADAVQSDLRMRYSWSYTERDHSHFDVRIFIDRTVAYIAVRLTAQSLMHRTYKKRSKPGSLRPTVAAAMVYLATRFRGGLSIVDNLCGSGTILCEAAAIGNKVSGGDIDAESVSISVSNLKNVVARLDPQVRVLDAVKTGWPDGSFDCAISNLPWGKQVDLRSTAALFEGTIKEYSRIVKGRGTVCVLTPRSEPLIKYAKKYMQGCQIKLIPVSFTGQSPTIIVVERS
ncbi:MAG TPA: methyltransferase domain-containing protein [Roseiflexaceae bacterium]|nr:methyltransferase domain-containing protein [Roseiflexaceae bacterium]